MYKKKLIIICIFCLIIILCLFFIKMFENKNDKNKEKRYDEIRESAKKAMEWKLRANYPRCPIGSTYEKEKKSHCNSQYLIDQGYIKKEELLDVDLVNYCDIYVETYTYFENPQDLQNNCEVDYKVYLKCMDYEDKGYMDWGD